MAIRKDANSLTSAERTELVDAIKVLKAEGVYDQFVLRHANTPMGDIHRCPAFLPWHRRFIWDLERELQRVSGNTDLGLPYWNWPVGGADASMWENDLLGGDGDPITGVVLSGPFREGEWTIVNSSGSAAGSLTRAFGTNGFATLSTQADIEQVLAVTPYDSPPWLAGSAPSFRDQVEGWTGPNLHNRGHVWVGGSMLPMTSPNDPVFFMHHCMVDKVWHEWQLRFPGQGYLPESGATFGQNLTDPMAGTPAGPVGSRPIDVLDSAGLGIEYDRLMPGTPGPVDPGDDEIELAVGAPPTESAIGMPGEIDVYRFEVASFGSYTLQTFGDSDTFMTLFGPDDPTAEVTANDDAGERLNARIVRTLSAGTYHARVRLYDPSRTGAYRIQVVRNSTDGGDAGPVIPELVIDAAATDGVIAVNRESDLFRFVVSVPGNYTVETEGATDMFLTLFGPGSQTDRIASDDDSGVGLNSRIRMFLQAGEYFARVRHFSSFGTGAYRIRVAAG
ncbi:MAG: tyrosinase family protein [Pseudomonadota bacterium]|nr:tyrosinase family protein [Pseudomonadota bacterium]